ncbi:MAG: hypothetical protein AAF744_10835 [Pseudomonadota bacterium]
MKKVLFALPLMMSLAVPASAEEAKPTPELFEQVVMAEQLIALGKARGDGILILAGIRMRSTLEDAPMPSPGAAFSTRYDAYAAALEAAKSDPALTGVIEDVKAMNSRGLCHGPGTVYGCF